MNLNKGKFAFIVISIILFAWINVVVHIYGSEATFLPFILITLLTVPISLVLTLLINITEPAISSNYLVLTFLLSGYFQFFYFIPWVTRKFTEKHEK